MGQRRVPRDQRRVLTPAAGVYLHAVAPRTRIRAFGSCAVLVIAGVICAVFIGGRVGTVLTIALMLAGLGGALLLVFFEVGLSEDHEREREEALRRNRDEAGRRPRGPRWPRRPQ